MTALSIFRKPGDPLDIANGYDGALVQEESDDEPVDGLSVIYFGRVDICFSRAIYITFRSILWMIFHSADYDDAGNAFDDDEFALGDNGRRLQAPERDEDRHGLLSPHADLSAGVN